MNFMNKTGPLMVVASLLAVSSLFGQAKNQNCTPKNANATPECVPDTPTKKFNQQPGDPECHPYQPPCQPQVCRPGKCGVLQDPLPPENAAYNAPAEVNVGLKGEIDFALTASFIYWQPTLDHFAYAFVDQQQIPATPVPGIKGKYLEMGFEFKPGFQIGAGANLSVDDWDFYAEYTRVHGTHSASSANASISNGSQASILPTMGNVYLLANNGGSVYQTANASYTNNLDFVDAELGRTYYVGKRLTFRSGCGMRTAWILQNVHVHYSYPSFLGGVADQNGTFGTLNSVLDFYDRIHSWGIGPRGGLSMNWMLGRCLRFVGSGYVDVLYTRYHLKDKTVLQPTVATGGSPTLGQSASVITRSTVPAVRTHLDLEIGLGLGHYFDQKNWHIDLLATYGFQVFFSQNMFRQYFDDVAPMVSTYSGDLNVQGLTLTARLDY